MTWGLRGILGQVALAEVCPETCPNVSEAGSGFSCELNSLPTKEEQPGLLAKRKRNHFQAKDSKMLKSKVIESELRCRGDGERTIFLPFWMANCDKKNNYLELLPRHFTL